MSQIETAKPLVKSINHIYSKRLFEYNNYEITGQIGQFYKVAGFENYNCLLDINSMFSNNPRFEPVDRTNTALGPIKYCQERPWTIPCQQLTLEAALELRVREICQQSQKINLLWSGGVDSTAIVVAFLRYAPDISQCRVIYSPWSTYEHPEFFNLLKSIPQLELIDISGEIYINLDLDGVFVSGNTSDEIHGSLDQSFFEEYGYDFLFTPWKDFFYKKLPSDNFIDFCEQHFAKSGQDIATILQARWWFYTSSKLTSILNIANLTFFASQDKLFDPKRLIGFFDCDVYEQFIYFNVDKIIATDNYASWRQFLKDFCCEYDNFEHWRVNKTKFGSNQIQVYTYKKQILNNKRHLMLLENGEKIASSNLPFFSQVEWDQIKHNYQYVFRQPYSV